MKTAFIAMMAVFLPCAAGLAANPMSISEELDAEYSYVGDAKTRGAGLNIGSIDEHSADVKYVVSPQVNKDLLLRFGFEWQRFSFGVPDHAAVPRVLQQASGVLGFDYQIADEWLLRMEVEPGIYSDFRDISWRDFDAPLVIGGGVSRRRRRAVVPRLEGRCALRIPRLARGGCPLEILRRVDTESHAAQPAAGIRGE